MVLYDIVPRAMSEVKARAVIYRKTRKGTLEFFTTLPFFTEMTIDEMAQQARNTCIKDGPLMGFIGFELRRPGATPLDSLNGEIIRPLELVWWDQ